MVKKKAVVYTRVSTDKEEQKLSLQIQREVYEEYCERQGWELTEIFADEGLTGTNARREKFIEMMYRAGLNYVRRENDSDIFETANDREPEFEYIITKDVSRYARNEEIGMSTAKQLRALGVYIIFEHGGISTKDKNWKLMLSILFSVAEGYSSDLSEKVKFTKRYHARKHKYRPSRLPYGYTWDKNKNIVIVPEQERIVKHIYDNYVQKGGLVLSKELNEMNVPTQRNHKWSSNKVIRIIKNSIYTGTAVVQRTYKDDVTSTKRKQRDESEFIHIPNAVPPIISLEQFEEVNEIRGERVNRERGKRTTHDDIYYQKVKCGVCGEDFSKHVTAVNENKQKVLYMCRSRLKQTRCGCRAISINLLNKGLEEIEIKYLAETIREAVQYKLLTEGLNNELERIEENRSRLQRRIDQLDSDCDDFLDSINEYKKNGQERLAKGFEKKFNQATDEREELEIQLEDTSVEKILKLKSKVEEKSDFIIQMKTNKNFTIEEKLSLLQKAIVTDYEVEYFFAMSNYDNEIKEFNKIFKDNQIETDFQTNGVKVRRAHKEAQEYWEQRSKDAEEHRRLQQEGQL